MRVRILVMVVMMTASAATVFAGSGSIWSYSGAAGPDKWSKLSPRWAVCDIGHYQSPIDIHDGIPAKMGPLSANIQSSPLSFGLDGPTFAVPYQAGSNLTINGTRYTVQQFHFHHPSEHTLHGKHYPMEAHLVLRREDSSHNNAVMGVLIKAGQENSMLNQFWNQLPRERNKKVKPVPVNVGDLLPRKKDYHMYEGSMTTPSCPQGVRWFVLNEPVEASQAQIDRFIGDFMGDETNNRPIQPAYGRVILKSK